MMDSNELLENTKKISKCMRMNAEHCFDGCSACDFYVTKEKRDETFKAVIAMLEGKDTNVPANSALDHIHNVVAEREYQRGYEQGKADAAPKWIPVKAHPATEEERESRPDIDYWFDCEMPDDEQEILVTVKHKNWIGVEKDVCYVEDSYGLDSGYDWLDDVIAWMPLPEPYKEG